MDPDAPCGLSDAGPDLENPAPQSLHLQVLPGGCVEVVSQDQEHLVGQGVQQQTKLIGPKAVAEALQVDLKALM